MSAYEVCENFGYDDYYEEDQNAPHRNPLVGRRPKPFVVIPIFHRNVTKQMMHK